MKIRLSALLATCASALNPGPYPVEAAAALPPRPNIVVILADDLGYGDVRCYNPQRGRIPTPCVDRLAAQGMQFTDAHSSSGVCSPSRYTLLTGRCGDTRRTFGRAAIACRSSCAGRAW
jgi:arylsulfatase A-like enzyme